MPAPVLGRLRPLRALELGDEFAHLLRARAGHHQHRIGRRHHHEIVGADDGGEPVDRMDHAIARIRRHHGAVDRVAGLVALGDVEDRVPGADVGPAEVAGDDGGAIGLLHHRVVDRLLRRAAERPGLEPHETEIVACAGDRGFHRGHHVRLEARKLRQQHVGAKQEIARIPQIALGDIARRGFGVRLFHERLDRVDPVRTGRLAAADVAVAGLGRARRDAEGDDAPGLRRLEPGEAGGAEFLDIEDDVVGGERQHHGIGIAASGKRRRRRHRRA